nr:MAG TPA: hypothetical protein [Caudoviricetes sp.]DAP31327.1 MAG TPA: hypothetical protein [Caudoviricetes sp.]
MVLRHTRTVTAFVIMLFMLLSLAMILQQLEH